MRELDDVAPRRVLFLYSKRVMLRVRQCRRADRCFREFKRTLIPQERRPMVEKREEREGQRAFARERRISH